MTKGFSMELDDATLMAFIEAFGGMLQGKDDETQGAAAQKAWEDNWANYLPASGRGRFVYHHHWRGLSEDEIGMEEAALLRTDHSVHGDIRLEGDDALWGIAAFLGTAAEVRAAGGDKLEKLPAADKIEGAIKLPQPKNWLDIGRPRPFVTEPETPGATSRAFAKFFAHDWGTYEMGMVTQNGVEVFLKGRKLRGRFLFTHVPTGGGERKWMISRPEDQTPQAETVDLVAAYRDEKSKGRRWIYLAKPGTRPVLVDVKEDTEDSVAAFARQIGKRAARFIKDDGARRARIVKQDVEKRLVYGVVLEPDSVDAQDDTISAEDIEKTAHKYLIDSRVIGEQHEKPAQAVVVESYIQPVDMDASGGVVKKGSWVMVVRIDDPEIWAKVKNGDMTGFSIGGFGRREYETP